MTKLPKNIIAKYGITKKAWAVFRGKKRKTGGKSTMAKKKSYSKSSGNPMMNRAIKTLVTVGSAAVYGAVRGPLASKLPSIPKMENYSAETILGGSAAVLNILTGNKYVHYATAPVLNIEGARVGEKLRAGVSLGSGNAAVNESIGGMVFY